MAIRVIDPAVWNAAKITRMDKKGIRALIKDCASIQIFIHPLYWSHDDNTVPRIEVSKVWATEFVREVPAENLPGIQVIDFNGEKLMRWWPEGTYGAISG